MIIVGSCVGDGGEKFDALVRPGLQRVLSPDDVVTTRSGAEGICAAYNSMIMLARSRPDCEMLVLLHDDVEVVDPNFRAKLLKAVGRPDVAVAGVVGGRGLRSVGWWEARHTSGAVFESRRHINFGARAAEVDCVDGLLMAISPRAFRRFEFDEATLPAFHGYDVDYCLNARAAGLTNVVVPVDVLHRTKGGFGDTAAFLSAERALMTKWEQWIRPEPTLSLHRLRESADRLQSYAVPTARRARQLARRLPARRNPLGPEASSRESRIREAQLRVDWMKLAVPDGMVLHIGCRTGEFVVTAERNGYEAYGVEPDGGSAQTARELGAEVMAGSLQDWITANPGIRPDAVLLWHVIQEVPEPDELLEQVRQLLGQGGKVLLEVPTSESEDAVIEGDGSHHRADGQLHHFSPTALRELFEGHGFQVEQLLEISPRIYLDEDEWKAAKNRALLERRQWPPLAYLRLVAVAA